MSYQLYEGPSMLNGKPIAAFVTGIDTISRNPKTGPMAQTFVLAADVDPLTAIKTGQDKSVCGSCPLRGTEGRKRSCYVTVFQAPTQVYRYRDNAKPLRKGLFKNRMIRLGAYGDHAAMPTAVTDRVVKEALGHTGYTHQWKTCDQDLSRYLMASVESEEDRELAKSMGWATFRIKTVDQAKLKGETLCPASEEAGKRMTCFTCGKCAGGKAKDVVINVHGFGKKNFT